MVRVPGRKVAERFATGVGTFTRSSIKTSIQRAVGPYLQALEEEGFGKEQLEYIVANNISFYRTIMPEPWREQTLKGMRKHRDLVSEAVKNSDAFIYLLMQSMAEIAPWFPEVVTYERRGWLQNELQEISKDVEKA